MYLLLFAMFASSCRADLEKPIETAVLVVTPSPIPNAPALQCARNMLLAAGKRGPESAKLPALYVAASVNKDDEFLMYMLSIIYVESRFDRKAISMVGARGLMQMTEIALEQTVKDCPHLRGIGDINRLHDSVTNVKYGSCYLHTLHEQMDGDWTRTLIAYNGGYKQLIKYDAGESIANETANYVLKVRRILHSVCATEYVVD